MSLRIDTSGRAKPRFEIGARVRTRSACSSFYAKGQHGTVLEDAGDGTVRVHFDSGVRWWVVDDDLERIPRRRGGSVFGRIALAWIGIWKGARA